MKFEKSFFVKQQFVPEDLGRFRNSAMRDLEIARTSKHAEVKFHFTYMALVKAGIFCIAREGYRVRSKPGHHQKIVEALSEITGDQDVWIIGNKMRRDRNADLYDSTGRYNDKEVEGYCSFVFAVLKKL
jgi:hypothetical protein